MLNHSGRLHQPPPPLLIQRSSAVPPAPRVLKASASVDKDEECYTRKRSCIFTLPFTIPLLYQVIILITSTYSILLYIVTIHCYYTSHHLKIRDAQLLHSQKCSLGPCAEPAKLQRQPPVCMALYLVSPEMGQAAIQVVLQHVFFERFTISSRPRTSSYPGEPLSAKGLRSCSKPEAPPIMPQGKSGPFFAFGPHDL